MRVRNQSAPESWEADVLLICVVARIEEVQQREEEGRACGVRCLGSLRTWPMDIAWAFGGLYARNFV